ncbi:MAG TPA: tyrosine--tRNA ligase [Pseudonocardia sp.]|jgi:tyrosyl-tRNA synthetase
MTDVGGTLLDELSWRGLIHDSTDPAELREHLETGRRRFYIGFDPSASSLTIGNLLPMTLIMRGARAGLKPVVLFGGGTGMIGDPSGKSAERSLLVADEVTQNVGRHQQLMSGIFERALGTDNLPEFVNNADWLNTTSMIDFLRDVGKHFPVTEMLRRDSVKRRLDDPDVGLTFTEFSYSLLQAYDFAHLRANFGVTLQMGASDQWGNIVAGIDYVRRVLRERVHGLTCPLLLRSDGTKFGKTEKGAVWISADRTSPYTLYQFIINLADADAERFALFFSLEPRHRLEKLLAEHAERPSRRALQRHLASEMTTLLHGEDLSRKAEAASEALFSGEVRSIDADMLGDVFADVPTVDLQRADLDGDGLSAPDLVVALGLARGKREAREHLSNGAVTVNGAKVTEHSVIAENDLMHGAVILVRRGKREWRVARFS